MPSSDPYATLPRHGETCICRRCRHARQRARWESWEDRRPAVERVLSDEAAAHIALLIRHRWKQTEIADAAGVAPSTISTAKERGVLINRTTHEAILSVRPTQRRR